MSQLNGKHVLLVVGQRNYEDSEFEYLYQHFMESGAVVTVASQKTEKALGRLRGYTVPHLTLIEAKPENFDAVVLIGGYGAYVFLWDDPPLHQLLQQFNDAHKIIAAASSSVVALANAGILKGKKATSYPDYNAAVILKEKGADHVYENVVIDDNMITSNHPRALEEFGETIKSKLSEI